MSLLGGPAVNGLSASNTAPPRSASQPGRVHAAAALKHVDPVQLIPHIRALSETLQQATDDQLQREVRVVRTELARGFKPGEPHVVVAGMSLACEAIRRACGVKLYDVQLLAAMAMTRRCIAQMQTGEGKTFVALASALHLALAGRGVHVVTPNVYLAERDSQRAGKVAAVLGLSAALLPERVDAAQKRPAYDADITYGTGHEFGFDYLRDQLSLRQQAQQKLGERLLQQLRSDSDSARVSMQRGLAFAVVDEADSVLIDDAGSPLVLSFMSGEEAPDAAAHRMARLLADSLNVNSEYTLEESSGRVALTESGIQRIHAADVDIPVLQLARPWTEYVQQALRARHLFRRGIHYVVVNDEVRIVDESTGRIFEDRSWQDGLHQAIEAREELKITAEKAAIAQVTRQRFFRLYEHLSGMTGTATGCDRELLDVYQLEVHEIPLRVPSQRRMMPTRFFATQEAKWAAIAQAASEEHAAGRSVLIGTRSISESEFIALQLKRSQLPCEVLNGLQDATEADIVARAGQPGAITIATNLAGRGTDILLHCDVKAAGGLHVIVAECQTSSRMDRQLIGRCARQGDPGSAQVFVSADDTLIRHFGPWLAAALQRESNSSGEVEIDFTSQLRRIQASAERQSYTSRIHMLQKDVSRDSLLKKMR